MFWFRFDDESDDLWSSSDARGPEPPRPARTTLVLARLRVGESGKSYAIEYVVGPEVRAEVVSIVLTLHDVRGRIVRTLKNRRGAAGSGRVIWDGTDAFGAPVEPGLYYARLFAGGVIRLTSVMVSD